MAREEMAGEHERLPAGVTGEGWESWEGWGGATRQKTRPAVRRGALESSSRALLAETESFEAFDEDVLAEFGDQCLEKLADGLLGILDECLFEQA